MFPLVLSDRVSLSEIVDHHFALHSRLPSRRRTRKRSTWLVAAGAASGSAVGASGIGDKHWILGATFAAVIAAVVLWLYPRRYDSLVRTSIRRALTDALGPEGPYEVMYEIDEQTIVVSGFGPKMTFDWNDLVSIDDTKPALLLWFTATSSIRFSARAFESAEQHSSIVAKATQQLETHSPNSSM